MFKDFLDLDNDIALENDVALANFLDIDEEIATEGVKEFVGKQKDRIKAFVQKVAAFIVKITQKIKVFFLKVTKADYYSIDKNDYKNATEAIKILDKAQPSIKAKVALLRVGKGDKVTSKDLGIEEMDNATTALQEAVTQAEARIAWIGQSDKTQDLSFRSGSLTSLQGSLQNKIKKLTESKNTLEKSAAALNDTTTVHSQSLSAAMRLTTAQISAISTHYSILGKILSSSTRPNAKSKVSQKSLGKLPKDK